MCTVLNENTEKHILNFLENKAEIYTERDPYAYDPKARYSPATLINEWYEDRQEKPPPQVDSPLISEYMDCYRKLCTYSLPDRKEYFTRMFDSRGLGQEILMDHLGKAYYNNFTTSYDLSYNHLVKGLCGPFPRKYINGRYIPEIDLSLIYGNLTQWGLKEKFKAEKELICRPLPPQPEYRSEFIAYDRADVKRLNDFPFHGRKKTSLPGGGQYLENILASTNIFAITMTCSERVELKDLDFISASGHINGPFSVSWSEDDKIALMVDEGVHIFELCPTPFSDQLNVTFLRSWIAVPTDLPFQNVVNNNANSFVWKLKRKEVYEMALDSTLTTIVQKSSVSSFFTQCKFSPLIYNESYLTSLTNNGVLQIYKWCMTEWKPIINVSNLWLEYCTTENVSESMVYDVLKLKLSQLKIISMCWFDKPRIFFVTGHEDGCICIWRVELNNKWFTMNVHHCFHITGKPTYIYICDIGLENTCLCVIGTSVGTVKYAVFELTTEVSLKSVGNETGLWDYEDFIKLNMVKTDVLGDHKYLFTSKNHILVIQKFEIGKDKNINILKTEWHEFPDLIVSFNKYRDNFVIGLRNHDFFLLQMEETGFKIEKNLDIPLKQQQLSCFHCYGLAMSRNKNIWMIISSIKVNYDVKTVKDTTNILIFVPKFKTFKSLTDTTSSGLLKQVIKNYQNAKLSEISDLVELMKYELLIDPSNYSDNPTLSLNSSALELKLIIWETKHKIFTQSVENYDIVTQCENLLAQQWCSERRIYLKKQSYLTDLQKQSLELMEFFLDPNTSKILKGGHCPICDCVTSAENIRLSSCANSHFFPRCSLSLLPCDSVPYAFCRMCDSTVNLEFISDNDFRCIFCDGLLVPDTRVIV